MLWMNCKVLSNVRDFWHFSHFSIFCPNEQEKKLCNSHVIVLALEEGNNQWTCGVIYHLSVKIEHGKSSVALGISASYTTYIWPLSVKQ